MWGRGLKLTKLRVIRAVLKSPLMWGRGLKLNIKVRRTNIVVAPHVGAWIETLDESGNFFDIMSPLMWGRGLKLHRLKRLHLVILSPLMWGRGLKLRISDKFVNVVGRPSCGGVD